MSAVLLKDSGESITIKPDHTNTKKHANTNHTILSERFSKANIPSVSTPLRLPLHFGQFIMIEYNV